MLGIVPPVVAGSGSAAGAVGAAAWAVPLVGAAVSAVALGIQLWLNRKGPQQKVATSAWADEAERLLQENVRAFQAAPSREMQSAARENFNRVWGGLVSACGDPAMGEPGRRCISERTRGGRWDWFALYLDPIEQWQAPAGEGFGFDLGGGGANNTLMLAAGLGALALAAFLWGAK